MVLHVQLPYNQVDSIHLIVLGTIGFVETLIEVNESIGEATLNVNMRLNSSIQFEIIFSLFANTMIDSSGMGNATQYFHLSAVILVLYLSMLQLVSTIVYLGLTIISGLRTCHFTLMILSVHKASV